MSINQKELDYELYRRDKQVDVHYYRAVTGNADSAATIYDRLTKLEHGFDCSDVSFETFKENYIFGQFQYTKDWIRFYAEKGLRLKVNDLYLYLYKAES